MKLQKQRLPLPHKARRNKNLDGNILSDRNNRICPVEKAGSLDTKLRRWLQKPEKILGPYIKEGMTILDFGCGPGFFSVDIAHMVGQSGRVIAADLQEGMLNKLREKIAGTEIENRIFLHKCEENKIGISENVDFVLAFYIIHEVINKEGLFAELETILKPNGNLLIVEPPFHVSKKAFEVSIGKAKAAGLTEVDRPKVPFNRAVVLKKD
jgi:ubiquinone/menaquinone biosynthesis C-methylase UbiE